MKLLDKIKDRLPSSLSDVILAMAMFSLLILAITGIYVFYLAISIIFIPVFTNPQVGLIEKELMFIILLLLFGSFRGNSSEE